MLNFLVAIQILATLVCYTAVLVVAIQKKTSSYSNVIIITFLCGFVQNGGYILELTAKDVTQGITAVKAEYLGGAFEVCLLTFFMFKYCGHEFNKWLRTALIVEGMLVLVGVWSWEYTHMYYTAVDFVADAEIPHLVMQHGWLYYAYAITTVVELIACIFILVVSILKTNQEHMRYNYGILLLVVLIPFLGYIFTIVGILSGFDATPISCAFSIGVFAFAIARKRVFDVADAAGDLILANMDNAVIIKNTEDGYEYSNNRAKELFPVLNQYSRGNIIKDVELKKIFDKTRDNKVTINKKTYDVRINDVKVRDENIGTTIILFDVTESNKQIEQMKQLTEEAKYANKSKTAFLTSMSQEIRNPINIIMGMNEIMLRNYCTEETENYLVDIHNSGTTLLNLINDILDFSKIETGKIDFYQAKFDLKALVSSISSIYSFRSAEKGISFSHEIATGIPRYVIGDEGKVKQVFNNLLFNAVKYTDKGSVKLKLNFKYRSEDNIDLILAVEDTGTGISEKDQKNMLSEKIGQDRKNDYQNNTTALGLMNIKHIVELMGGIFNFKSELGKGSVFSVIIPLSISTDSSDTLGEVTYKIDKANLLRTPFVCPKAEILAVDESEECLTIAAELLKETEAKVTTVKSGEECLKLVQEKHFDIIFMEDKMSGMDGITTYSRMKQMANKCSDTPVIMHTSAVSPEMKELYISKGFTEFLPKPATFEQIVTILYKRLPEAIIEKTDTDENK